MTKTYFNWSTGKDSALALYHLCNNPSLDVQLLLTTVNGHHDRVSMHGLHRDLLNRQNAALDLPLRTLELPEQPSMKEYDALMSETLADLKAEGFTDSGFGDIFLEDLRAYREKQLKGITCHFPLWKRDTTELFHEFVDLGFKAVVVCLNGDLLDASFLGRALDASFLKDLPTHVDPCGENGEFHTFCYDGPIFSHPVAFKQGEKILRKYKTPNGEAGQETGFWFLDIT